MAIKRPKKAKIVPTEKQKMAVVAMVENGGNKGKALKSVGYSDAMCKTPNKVLESEGYKEARKPVLEQLESLRQQYIDQAVKTAAEASSGDSMRGVDIITKNIQLLGGGATERVENRIDGIEYIIPGGDKS